MPQMSPMNWMFISLLFLLIYLFMKTHLNLEFKSKNNSMKIINKNSKNLEW